MVLGGALQWHLEVVINEAERDELAIRDETNEVCYET
jgi:hypothetical protein